MDEALEQHQHQETPKTHNTRTAAGAAEPAEEPAPPPELRPAPEDQETQDPSADMQGMGNRKET